MNDTSALLHAKITDSQVGIITIARPERRNALNRQLKAALIDQIALFAADESVAVIILTGGDRYFVAGSDIGEMASMGAAEMLASGGDRLFANVRGCPKPVIAAVEGYALGGGCELALSCDLIVAGDTASFGQPEIRLGIMPGAGGTQILPRMIGKYRAMRLVLTGEAIGAREAEAMGLVSVLAPAGEAIAAAIALAEKIAAQSRPAVSAALEAIRLSEETTLAVGLHAERKAFCHLFDTPHQKSAMKRFVKQHQE